MRLLHPRFRKQFLLTIFIEIFIKIFIFIFIESSVMLGSYWNDFMS